MRLKRLAVGLAFGLAAVAALALVRVARHGRLPSEIRIDDPVIDLTSALERATVEAPGEPVRRGEIRPGSRLRAEGERPGLVTPAGSRLRFRLDLPAGAVVRFAVGVEGTGTREPDRAGVRFALMVDGRERWSRVVNPAASRRDRRWFDERVDLGLASDRSVELVLATDADAPGRALAGTPAWANAQVVRPTRRARQPAAPATPNVLVLLVDTLRADRLGCYGAHPSPTPTLDRLASQGLIFEQLIAQSSWTLPSVASLFTGLYPRSHGALGERSDEDADASWGFLSDDVVTWPELALRAGITTFGVSGNPLVSRASNLAQGFESFIELGWDAEARNWTSAADVNRAFLAWLRSNRQYRFVAYLHYMDPHDPYTPPARLRPPDVDGLPPAIRAGSVREAANRINWHKAPPLPAVQVEHLRKLYAGEIASWDDELADLLDALNDLDLLDSTILVVTSDHGEEFQEHGRLVHQTQLYEELLRVPLVLVGPGIAPGRRSDLVQEVDLLPTMAGFLGFDPPAGLPGRSLLGEPAPRPALAETTNGIAPDGARIDLIALRTERWKLIHAPALDRFELYDLAHDPGEHEDRHATAPEAPALEATLRELERAAPEPPHSVGHDPGLHEKLRALGYVE